MKAAKISKPVQLAAIAHLYPSSRQANNAPAAQHIAAATAKYMK
jgi:hypothetical protein